MRLLLACLVGLVSPPLFASDAGHDVFENKIRPVFVQHCYPCHSVEAKKQRGGLLLDTRDGLRKGGDSGPVLVPGKPSESLLIRAVRQGGELKMPPKAKLPDSILADLERWIAMGAPDPRIASAKPVALDFEAAKRHWSYQPLRRPASPGVKQIEWPIKPLDSFILARLEAAGLKPSAPADLRTLLRRVTLDLVGLPPSFEEITAFEQAALRNPQAALEEVVDRLLASPHYGERWGRHWLDVARYADTKDGVLMFGDDRVRPYAYTYRDYVIRALNEDTPFDRFVQEQLAADLIEPKVEPWRLAAMGFLTLGRQFDNNVHDVIDDRIDTVTRGFLGLTVSCARCHDHKYDAIPTADYYSLYGIFASSDAPLELPLLVKPEDNPGHAEFERQAAAKRRELQEFFDRQYALQSETARQRVASYLAHVATTPPDPLETAVFFRVLDPDSLRPQIVAHWRRYLERHAKPDDPVFGPWHDLIRLPNEGFAAPAKLVVERWLKQPRGTGMGQLNPLVGEALAKSALHGKGDLARVYGDLLQRVYDESKRASAATGPASEAFRQLLAVLTRPDSPCFFPKSQTWQYMSRGDKDAFARKRNELDRLAVKSPDAPPRAMVLNDSPDLYQPRIFTRGNPSQLGDPVPRQFLRVLAGDQRQPFPHGSGRLDLARAMSARDNPLTARVIVNRVWMHHFGEPLVATPSDFGTRGTPPTHPELLDFLAHEFMANGWSLKWLHRQIVLSRTYQQASLDHAECRAVDPENQLLWRSHRRRLDLEAMRDTLLTLSGRLDHRMGGQPGDIVGNAANGRRTVYALVDRQSLPGLFRAFDFAVPDQSVERRPQTTVPQQALFGLNSPFLIEQARALVARTVGARDRVAALYRRALGRVPTAEEEQAALRFLEGTRTVPGSKLSAWEQLAQVLLLTNEVMFLD